MTNMLFAILLAVLNSLWQAALAAGLVWAMLKALPKFRIAVNAATRYAIWWVVLAVVLVLPLAPGFRNGLRLLWAPHAQPTSAAADAIRAHRVTVPVAVEAPAPVMLTEPKSAQWPWWIFGLGAAVFVYRLDQIGRSYFYLRGLKRRAASSPQALPAIARPARLLLSREVASPMAVGFLHPAVVLPDSLIDELSPAELGARAAASSESGAHRAAGRLDQSLGAGVGSGSGAASGGVVDSAADRTRAGDRVR